MRVIKEFNGQTFDTMSELYSYVLRCCDDHTTTENFYISSMYGAMQPLWYNMRKYCDTREVLFYACYDSSMHFIDVEGIEVDTVNGVCYCTNPEVSGITVVYRF